MKLVRCDGCKTETQSDATFGNPPAGWVTISRPSRPDVHVCSDKCAGDFFRQEVDRRVHGPLELVR
jgi:hypothetical protein